MRWDRLRYPSTPGPGRMMSRDEEGEDGVPAGPAIVVLLAWASPPPDPDTKAFAFVASRSVTRLVVPTQASTHSSSRGGGLAPCGTRSRLAVLRRLGLWGIGA
jgi:hypothetical protein